MKKNKKKLSEPMKIQKTSRFKSFLKRRPHRSFQLTKRRDYKRSLQMPGYIAFTKEVWKILWVNKKTFLSLAAVYGIATVLMVGVGSQDMYQSVKDSIESVSDGAFNSAFGKISQAGILFVTAASGGISETLSEVQQIYAVIILLLVWLTTVWLLRNIMAGHQVRLRDGIYSAGAPIFSTFLVSLLLIVQMLPLAIGLVILYAAGATELLSGGIEAMLCWIVVGLLATMSIYWITGTFFALVVVTLPGMYPMRAIRAAGDLVVGRRLRILLRMIWLLILTIFVWALIMIPVILVDSWVKHRVETLEFVPVVPIVLMIVTSFSVVWVSAYTYLYYRKVVADESNSA